ncbi:MAG TPA: ATP-dependent DNA helicase UvrD2, partial [Mycobacteriales bacterium]|nr:ATP-dependent DNA helicase UvrD2 [Mycobacteriales bacterium]
MGLADPSDAETVLAGLDPEQEEAARAIRGPVCILAGAGTGKTRTITHRIAYAVRTGAVPVGQLLAVTFTARAAGEMRTRLRALGVGRGAGGPGVQALTFHAAALRQLRYFGPRVLGGPVPELVDNKIRLVATAAAQAGVRETDRAALRDLAAEIEWAKVTLCPLSLYPARSAEAGREPPVPAGTVVAVMAAYEEAKARTGVLDFEDLLLVTAAAIEEHRDVAEELRSRYRHFVVDEYQDVSPLQQRLLDAWLGGRDDLCVVGDPNQTIYSFTGATPDHLLSFPRRFPGATVVRLVRDYRSTPQVVQLANRVLDRRSALRLVGQRAAGPEPTFAEYDDEPAEAASVSAACRAKLDAGTPASEVAVLFRVNAQSEVYERALADAGVPYVLRGGVRFFDRTEIREAMLLLRGAVRSAESGEKLADLVRDVLSALSWSAGSAPAGGAARERWESLAALVGVAEELAAVQPDAGLGDFLAELEQRAAAQHAPTVQGVTLASLHAAKGLEWDAVFLVGLVEGTVPIQYAVTDEQVAEERRLLYVGVTRARESVALSWALSRAPGGRRTRRRTRFLHGIASEAAAVRVAPARRRGAVELPDGADTELFGRLRAWRSARAEAQKVPAYVVFTDATLAELAVRQPADV